MFSPYVLISVLASESSSMVSPSDWAQVISDVTAQFSVTSIVSVISSIVVAGIGFIFLWWGVRKAYRFIMSAVRKGRGGV